MNEPSHHSHDATTARCLVLTVSDTRKTAAEDASGSVIAQYLKAAGHGDAERAFISDDAEVIRSAVLDAIERGNLDAIFVTGGTGVAPRDHTPDAVMPLIDKFLDGFGEAFRQLSFAEIGPKAILSRAFLGTARRSLVFVLPGSPKACELAMEKLAIPLLPHAVGLLRTPRGSA